MEPPSDFSRYSFAALKEKQRDIREAFPSDHGLRIHRALSWLDRAEQANDDHDAAFIFYWISFNAAYAQDRIEHVPVGERTSFDDYFEKLISLDTGRAIHEVIWEKFSGPVRVLLDNRYVFQPFWDHYNHIPGYDDWENRFNRSQRKIHRALLKPDVKIVLTTIFDRLYVLRNQLIHGGATWNSSVNRDQVRDGARILSFLVPLFIDLMMDNPELDWGSPYYPVVD